MSSHLFVLLMDILAKLLDRGAINGLFNLHPRCVAPFITHLSFVDYVLVFFDGSMSPVAGILNILEAFKLGSGLGIYKSKNRSYARWRRLCQVFFFSGYLSDETRSPPIDAHAPSNSFSASKTWMALHPPGVQVNWHRSIWFKDRVPKHAFISWVVAWNRLHTRDRLKSWGFSIHVVCVLCNSGDESREHLFFNCPYSSAVWTYFTRITLVFADCSKQIPEGILEDVPVKVGNSLIPAYFVVLDYGKEPKDPLILGRAFLTTAGARIDMKRGKISLNICDLKMEFGMDGSEITRAISSIASSHDTSP
ncbi:hypothetical protein AXX17_AT2G06440 [Arabidopsis thaliana]|uniref:Reverse transcriptase zinc-binding domain-containing protein n=1 Tax=Arabidopsis thaliana TaxID=3702 RepID=A0A178VXK1_ARATH|nr:hypothetical protein AXX17_AT2G06440 [Arabidopsis thaliana]